MDFFSCVGNFTHGNLVHNISIHLIVNTICLLPKLLQDLNKSFSQTLPESYDKTSLQNYSRVCHLKAKEKYCI